MSASCLSCANENCCIKFCSKEPLETISNSKTIERCKKGQFIFSEGNPVQGIYIIQSGKAKVTKSGYNDRVQTIRLATTGHLLGHRGLGNQYYAISAAAIEDTALCFIEKSVFSKILKTDVGLTYQLMVFYANELRSAEARMRNLAQMTVREKTAEALLLVRKSFGVIQKNTILLDVNLTRYDLAEIAGLRHEQVTRTLSDLRKEGILEFEGKKTIICQPDKLVKIIAPYYKEDAPAGETFSYLYSCS